MADTDYILYEQYSRLFSSKDAREVGLVHHLDETNTWGLGGAGLLILSPEYQEVLLFKRSGLVHDSGYWGITGGARNIIGNSLEKSLVTAVVESREEMGSLPKGKILQGPYVYSKEGTDFTYETYILEIDAAEKGLFVPRLNWEHDKYGWFEIDKLSELDVHPGVLYVLEQL
ncbi:MAG: NUDIX domain-containing protein [DPANN group archaeon]|nr:NUDIX domain-containing protein [DPANN group archaeon]